LLYLPQSTLTRGGLGRPADTFGKETRGTANWPHPLMNHRGAELTNHKTA
jgi:hypothetical protein